jgi:hypothetical protein
MWLFCSQPGAFHTYEVHINILMLSLLIHIHYHDSLKCLVQAVEQGDVMC